MRGRVRWASFPPLPRRPRLACCSATENGVGVAVESYYKRDGDTFLSSAFTRGPWHPDLQHAGPPSALLMRAFEGQAADFQIVRFSTDLLKPVPIAPLQVEVNEIIPGKRRRVLEARLYVAESGQQVARASALLLRRRDLPLGELPVHDGPAPPPPQDCPPVNMDFFQASPNYDDSLEQTLASGGIGSGQTQMWIRPRMPLVAGEEMTGLQRLLVVADSGNGVSMVLDKERFNFTNPDLTVNIRRVPEGEWLCLDAVTHCQPSGLGMAESRIWDARGVAANGTQNLLLEPVG